MTQKYTYPYIPEKFLLLHVLLYDIDNILNRIKKERATKCSPFLYFLNHSIYYSASYSMASLSVSSSSNA